MKDKSWFKVNRKGLSQIMGRRGIEFIVYELVQNAWDEVGVDTVDVKIDRAKGDRAITIEVTDNSPNGFTELSQSYELFAQSWKKSDATKRGRFNLGEKLVLALSRRAEIITTTGGIRFDDTGRHITKSKTESGTLFRASIVMSHAQMLACIDVDMEPPAGIKTTVNGRHLIARVPAGEALVTLATEIADSEGRIKRTRRKTTMQVLEIAGERGGWLYEMGIPVVETGDDYDVNICQRVPVNLERDNVPAGYLRAVRTQVANLMASEIKTEQSNNPWVRDALSDPHISKQAVKAIIAGRFGDKAVAYDPSDLESNSRAAAAGYQVVHGSQLSKKEWTQVRDNQA